MLTFSKFEKTDDLNEVFNDKFKVISDASAKYKSTIRTIENKKRNLVLKKPTSEELILRNKDKLLVYADDGDTSESKPKFCFISKSFVSIFIKLF